MAYTFDGPNKKIILTTTTSLNMRDLWSRWNDWVHTSDNSKYALAFSSIGGNVIDPSSGTSIPPYIFQQNGWKIRPMESNHTLSVFGGILVDLAGDPFADTIATFRVNIRYQQPVQAITVATGGGGGGSGSGLTPEQIAKFEEMYLKLDVNVSSRSSRGQVGNISLTGGYSKDDRKRDEKTAQYAENTLKLLKKMKTEIADSIVGVLDAIGGLQTDDKGFDQENILKAIEDAVKGKEIPEIFNQIPKALEGFVASTREYLEKAIRIGDTNMDTVKNRFTLVEKNIQSIVTIVGDIKTLHNEEKNTISESQKALTESVGSYQKAIETERKNTDMNIKRISTALTTSLKTIYTDISQIQDDISTGYEITIDE